MARLRIHGSFNHMELGTLLTLHVATPIHILEESADPAFLGILILKGEETVDSAVNFARQFPGVTLVEKFEE